MASQLVNMAYFAEVRGDTSAAIPLIRESLSLLASRPATDASVINTRRLLAIDLCATGATVEGDSLIRATIERVPLDSTQVMPYRVRDVLGFCLTRARRFAEAEPLLLQAEAGLRRLSCCGTAPQVAVTWLVSLYEQWERPRKRLCGRSDWPATLDGLPLFCSWTMPNGARTLETLVRQAFTRQGLVHRLASTSSLALRSRPSFPPTLAHQHSGYRSYHQEPSIILRDAVGAMRRLRRNVPTPEFPRHRGLEGRAEVTPTEFM